MDLEVKVMTKVLVKAYIPTIDEKRGISLDDIIDGGSLRYVRPGERNIGMDARNLSRHQRTARGANIPYEIDAHKHAGKSIPGLLDLDNPTKINPNFNITGTYVGPPNQGFLRRPDMSFMRNSPAVLLASTQNPEWWRTMAEGALTPAEGYKYGGFDKDTVVEIPLPKGVSTPQHLVYPSSQEALDFLSQFPSMPGSHQWRQKAGPRMDINQLIASGKLQPLSLDQRIQPHESPFLDDDVTRKVASEPMDLAFDAIKKNLNRWFKEKWVDVSRKDKDGKHPPCGRSKASKSSKGYPKCRPSVKVSSKTPKTSGSMSEGQKRAATKRKRSKKQGVGGKPTIVKVE